ncbi:MAG: DUF3892 domain-containing protein [Clostridiales bacterium]|jgi:hypothetical protein|nr:DUF3892 domain-containing protein [Clostridiales bacterium]
MAKNTTNQKTQQTYTANPMNTLQFIPTPKKNAQDIVALVKQSGKTVGYKLSNGQTVQKPQAISMAKTGDIKGVGVATRNGAEYLKSLPNQSGNNNLDDLPTESASQYQNFQ